MTGAILIVAHNNLHLTKRAVKTALAQSVPTFVMVVDNGSTDSTVRWLTARRRLSLEEGGSMCSVVAVRGMSLAACWNGGLSVFFRAGISKVLVLNNDVEIRPDSYKMLATYLDWSRDQEGLVSMAAVDSIEKTGHPGDRTIEDLYLSRSPHPDFSAFMIRAGTYRTVGPFDEEFYPAYVEDCCYHVRMHRNGIIASKIPLPFFHHHSATLANASPEERQIIEEGAARNRALFKKKFGCLPGTPEYEALFDKSSFGVDSRVALDTEP